MMKTRIGKMAGKGWKALGEKEIVANRASSNPERK